jgi:hypothetical protein
MDGVCPTCGKKIEGLGREIRLQYPQPIVDILCEDPSTNRFSVAPGGDFIRLDDKHFFIRALLPVTLDVGHVFRFGVWVAVDSKQAEHLWHIWDKPEYVNAMFTGHLANLVPPWNETIEGAECNVEVRDKDSLPFIVSSTHKIFSKILTMPWPVHECEAVIEQVWG